MIFFSVDFRVGDSTTSGTSWHRCTVRKPSLSYGELHVTTGERSAVKHVAYSVTQRSTHLWLLPMPPTQRAGAYQYLTMYTCMSTAALLRTVGRYASRRLPTCVPSLYCRNYEYCTYLQRLFGEKPRTGRLKVLASIFSLHRPRGGHRHPSRSAAPHSGRPLQL